MQNDREANKFNCLINKMNTILNWNNKKNRNNFFIYPHLAAKNHFVVCYSFLLCFINEKIKTCINLMAKMMQNIELLLYDSKF